MHSGDFNELCLLLFYYYSEDIDDSFILPFMVRSYSLAMFFQFFYVGKESLQKLKTNKQLELQTVVMQFVRYQPMLLETVLYFWSSKIYWKRKIVPLDSHVPLDSCLFFLGLVSVDLFGLTYTPQKGIFPLFFYSYLEFW